MDEIKWRYHLSKQGELWHLSIGEKQILLLNNRVLKNPEGASFQLMAERKISGSNVTFEHNKQDLIEMLPSLARHWSHWSSFSGISVHGLDE